MARSRAAASAAALACAFLLCAASPAQCAESAGKNSHRTRSLSGLPTATIATPAPTTPAPTTPPPPTPPPLSTTPWLPQCTSVNAGSSYTLLARPASVLEASASVVVNTKMTGEEYVASTGFDESKLGPKPVSTIAGNVTSTAVCASNTPLRMGPTASRTTCYLVSCAPGFQCFPCGGTFVADPSGQGRLLFLTSTSCVAFKANNVINVMSLSTSFVTCNRDGGTTKQGDGIFQPTALTMSRIDFNLGYGIASGALIQLLALSNTNLAYAKPVAVGAVTNAGLAQSFPNFSAGFPQVDAAIQGCTLANLVNVEAIHYSRENAVRTLTNTGIDVPGFSGCFGDGGGPAIDESACLLWGVSTAISTLCTNGVSTNTYSRIVATAAENGVPFLALASGLVTGQTLFVN